MVVVVVGLWWCCVVLCSARSLHFEVMHDEQAQYENGNGNDVASS